MERAQIIKERTIQVLREEDFLWRLEGGRGKEMLVGLIAATEHLTAGKIYLRPGQSSDLEVHGGDECLYLLEGTLNVFWP